jgi:hypothetical protein
MISGAPKSPGVFNPVYSGTDGSGTTRSVTFSWTVYANEIRTFSGTASSSTPTKAFGLAIGKAQTAAKNAGFMLVNCTELDSTVEQDEFGSYTATSSISCFR